MFVDEVRVYARAGHGGRGCVAFLREAHRPKGGPAGGDGGRGGDVILEANQDLNNLVAQYYQPRLIAENGKHGMGKGMHGRAGRDLVVQVPTGTMVWRLTEVETDVTPGDETCDSEMPGHKLAANHTIPDSRGLTKSCSPDNEDRIFSGSPPPQIQGSPPGLTGRRSPGILVADLTEHGQRHVLCKGGRGGLGNKHFATSRNQAPRFAQKGEPGEEGWFLLEL
ncbi:MAG: GTPase ObgE, partial [Verrucomicrobiae bacterium]|nr:GTPase ObgE [Verrucomicrobiae bacterium]